MISCAELAALLEICVRTVKLALVAPDGMNRARIGDDRDPAAGQLPDSSGFTRRKR